MARPKKLPDDSGLVHLTVPGATLAGLDEWVADLRTGVGGSGITRSDLIRDILAKALDDRVVQAPLGKAAKAGRRTKVAGLRNPAGKGSKIAR